jgi:hypothetical protein
MPLQHPFHPGAGFRDRVVHCSAQLYLDGQQPDSRVNSWAIDGERYCVFDADARFAQ